MAVPTPKQYIADFEKLGMGMFIHWGLYSQIGQGEWIYDSDKLDMNEYKKLADTFTAEDFDADEIALTAKNAGCRYAVLTTRHHEGFSLFDTQGLSDFDVMHTPCKRDLVKEFADACRRHGIVPFFYHTTLDWYNTDFENDFDKYLDYLNKSVEILCKNYGKIGGLWFDGNWSKPDSNWKEDELYGTIRKYQPEAMIINNTGLNARGEPGHIEIDSVTYEQGRPEPMNRDGMRKYLAAEMCETLNDHWATATMDFNYKSPSYLIKNICLCRKVGANYLINIGPLAQGAVDPYQRELMKLIGKWVSVYKEALYDVKPYPVVSSNENFILKGDNGKLYLFCMNPSRIGDINVLVGGKSVSLCAFKNVKDKVKSIKWIDNGEFLRFTQTDDMLSVDFSDLKYGLSYCVRVAVAEIE